MIKVQLTESAKRVLASIKVFPRTMAQELGRELRLQNELTVGHIQKERMTGQGPFPVSEGKLGVVTNRLRSSLRAGKVEIGSTGISATIGSNVLYAGLHEFGFDGTVTVKSFTRRLAARDLLNIGGMQVKRGTASRLLGGNLKKFAKTASGMSVVKSHQRRIHMPARSPISQGINDRLTLYVTSLSGAIENAWNKQK